MAIEITDEMRTAVLAEICANQGGHILDTQNMFTYGEHAVTVRSKTDGRMPYIVCSRCELTWLVIDEPGIGYDDAEGRLRLRLKAADPVNKRAKARAAKQG